MGTAKNDPIREALENLAEAAKSLACHGAGGYTIDTSALDAVFLRSLVNLYHSFLVEDANCEYFDPFGDIWNSLPSEV